MASYWPFLADFSTLGRDVGEMIDVNGAPSSRFCVGLRMVVKRECPATCVRHMSTWISAVFWDR